MGFANIINAFTYRTSREIKTIWPKLSLAIYRVKKPALELVVIAASGTGAQGAVTVVLHGAVTAFSPDQPWRGCQLLQYNPRALPTIFTLNFLKH